MNYFICSIAVGFFLAMCVNLAHWQLTALKDFTE